ncbi:MAG: type II toxin-antitoxin system Phd/YefM family antitoxin [Gammaproteobacteria bacterium]|nr:type II toxin-antitoxin system Phd/YefM family antitoxin [Gammaproteobacteria bacterium]
MDQVTDRREPVLIRRRGREAVALIAADELTGWIETVQRALRQVVAPHRSGAPPGPSGRRRPCHVPRGGYHY